MNILQRLRREQDKQARPSPPHDGKAALVLYPVQNLGAALRVSRNPGTVARQQENAVMRQFPGWSGIF